MARATHLRELAVRAVDASLPTPDEFCDAFPTLGTSHGAVLQHVYLQAQGCLRENATVRALARRVMWSLDRPRFACAAPAGRN